MVYELNELNFTYDALEPEIDEQTMHLHHDKHHAAYVNKLNIVLSDCKYPENQSLENLVKNIKNLSLSDSIRNLIKFNAGGHYNHSLFWEILTPGGASQPSGDLLFAMDHSFGSFEKFIIDFEKSALAHLGSGWTWLCVDQKNKDELFICSTLNHDNPLMLDYVDRCGYPIMLLDLWEHAYYLKYNNRKADYIKAFWNVINWDKVTERFSKLRH